MTSGGSERCASEILGSLHGFIDRTVIPTSVTRAALDQRWSDSGAQALTGPVDRPLDAPEELTRRLAWIEGALGAGSAAVGERVAADVFAALVERAALSGWRRAGVVSAGGATRLLESRDGWIALSLARQEDRDAIAAWLRSEPDTAIWSFVERSVARRSSEELIARGVLLGLPVARVDEAVNLGPAVIPTFVPGASDPSPRSLVGAVVVDLSSLWAGPLCARTLQRAGARVIKVESTRRPDGAREAPSGHFDLLHSGQESVALDFATESGRRALHELISFADVVIEGSRPRALAQLGIDLDGIVRGPRARIWVSITGYGRSGAGANRVAFGDDAAVAGGLVAWHEGRPSFVVDAVADPLSGMVAALATFAAAAAGGTWILDVALARTARALSGRSPSSDGGTWRLSGDRAISETTAAMPNVDRRAPLLGAHTHAVLSELDAGRRR